MTPVFAPGLALADLVPGQMHVWLARPAQLGHAELEARHAHVLGAAERAFHQALRFPRDRHTYLCAHAMARCVLAALCGCQPGQVQFASDAKGKPQVLLDPSEGQIGYNLSHTDGLVACVVARALDVGIDVERCRALDDMGALAASIFTPSELAQLEACPSAQRGALFFRLWTLKEAYAKASGDGIAADLSHVSFGFDAGALTARFTEDRGNWRFDSAPVDQTHQLALAARTAGPQALPAPIVHECSL